MFWHLISPRPKNGINRFFHVCPTDQLSNVHIHSPSQLHFICWGLRALSSPEVNAFFDPKALQRQMGERLQSGRCMDMASARDTMYTSMDLNKPIVEIGQRCLETASCGHTSYAILWWDHVLNSWKAIMKSWEVPETTMDKHNLEVWIWVDWRFSSHMHLYFITFWCH